MIFDSLENAGKYYNISHGIRVGLDFLRTFDIKNAEDGRVEIADGIYANIQTYIPKPHSEGKFEAHKKFIDIQYVFSGREIVGVSDYANFEPLIKYDKEKDIEFLSFKNSGQPEMVELHSNRFLILFPQDAHMPSLELDSKEPVKKVVVKIAV